jgi:hypothetical protein
MSEIKKLYFITHPAYSIADAAKHRRRTPSSIKQFIQSEIIPVLEKARNEPASAIVIIPTDTQTAREYVKQTLKRTGRNPEGLSTGRIRKTSETEKKLVQLANTIAGKEKILVLDQLDSALDAPHALAEALQKRKMVLKRPVDVQGYGSYRTWCAKQYPDKVHGMLNLLGKLEIKENGTLPEHRQTNPRTKTRRLPR